MNRKEKSENRSFWSASFHMQFLTWLVNFSSMTKRRLTVFSSSSTRWHIHLPFSSASKIERRHARKWYCWLEGKLVMLQALLQGPIQKLSFSNVKEWSLRCRVFVDKITVFSRASLCQVCHELELNFLLCHRDACQFSWWRWRLWTLSRCFKWAAIGSWDSSVRPKKIG